MTIQWKQLFFCLAIPLAVGALSAGLSGGGMESYMALSKPALSPPGWVFPVVWTILYLMMGAASYLVLTSGGEETAVRTALLVYLVQLAVNFFWPILFFRQEQYLSAFVWLVLLWLLVLCTTLLFAGISKKAGWLMVPYLLWVTFAGYLNLSFYLLN